MNYGVRNYNPIYKPKTNRKGNKKINNSNKVIYIV